MITVPKRYEWMGPFFRDLYIRHRYLMINSFIYDWDLVFKSSEELSKYFMSTSNPKYRDIINKMTNFK